MKTYLKYSVLSGFLLTGVIAATGSHPGANSYLEGQEEDLTGVPGDNFSLEGALELFKRSASPEQFEQLLNSADSKVNNLDLNGDGDIDYIKVIDRNEGNVHAFILQAIVSERESQDIAVIELEKHADGKAVLQIVGDADIYGIETIIEPTEEVRINAGASTARTVVNVWSWPSVQYVYDPYYSVWISPWRWSLRPVWYHPWRPIAYYDYNPYWAPYRNYYSVCHTHRVAYGQRIYRPYRTSSVTVYSRHRSEIEHYRSTRDGNSRGNGRREYTNGRETTNQRTSSDRHTSDDTRRSATSQPDNNRSTGRNSNGQHNSSGVTRRTPAIEEGVRLPRERSTSVYRTPDATQGSRSIRNPSPDVTRRTPSVQPRRDDGGRRPAAVQQNRASRGAQPVQRSGDGGGSRGSGEKQRGRH